MNYNMLLQMCLSINVQKRSYLLQQKTNKVSTVTFEHPSLSYKDSGLDLGGHRGTVKREKEIIYLVPRLDVYVDIHCMQPDDTLQVNVCIIKTSIYNV